MKPQNESTPSHGRNLGAKTILLAVATLCFGCADGVPQLYKVQGTIEFQNAPLKRVAVLLSPQNDSSSRGSHAITDEEGKFLFTSGNQPGVLPGKYVLYVQDPEALLSNETRPDLQPLLEKYGDPKKSPYQLSVEGDLENLSIKLD